MIISRPRNIFTVFTKANKIYYNFNFIRIKAKVLMETIQIMEMVIKKKGMGAVRFVSVQEYNV